MARKVSTSFSGSTSKQTDPGAHSQSVVIGNAVGDTAFLYDYLTGENSPGTTHSHEGSGTGVPLGLPLCNMAVVLSGSDGATAERKRFTSYSSSVVNNAYLFFFPVYLPTGETAIDLRFNVNNPDGLFMVCKSVTDLSDAGEAGQEYGEDSFHGKVNSLTGGTVYLIGVKTRLGPLELTRTWDGLSVFFPAAETNHYATIPEYTNANATQVEVATTAGASSSVVLSTTDWDSTMFATDIAVHAQIVDRLAKNQHGIAEHLTGTPAGGNAAYTLVSSTGVDPASSAFHDHSVSSHADEQEIDFVVAAEALGSCTATNTGTVQSTTAYWGAPQSRNTSTDNLLSDMIVHMPDFPDGTTTSRLKLAVLTGNAGKSTVTVKAQAVGETAGSGLARSGTAAQITTTSYGYVVLGGSGGRIDFGGGEANRLLIMTTDSDGGATNSGIFLGYCWFFDGDG